jgi:hypothetical protein
MVRRSPVSDKPDRWFTSKVSVTAQDLYRLLLEFRKQLEFARRGNHGSRCPAGCPGDTHPVTWQHGHDYDASFEALADVIDAYRAALGQPPDPRIRCPGYGLGEQP